MVGWIVPVKSQEILSHRIRLARSLSGLTQEKVAIALGCNPTTISNWESGRTAKPNIGLLLRFANAVGCDIAWLYQKEPLENVPAKDHQNPRSPGENDDEG